MSYIENPKTAGSGILCCIPQNTKCPIGCPDCFFQSGRSYLEPLDKNLPNIPPVENTKNKVVRVNDGNDSNVDRATVIATAKQFDMKFFNTSIPNDLEGFEDPVVLTLNPAINTDKHITILKEIPKNLMFVRVRTNTWNLELVRRAVIHYTELRVPVVLTFLAYYDQSSIPEEHKGNYIYRTRTLNPYWAITTAAWEKVMSNVAHNLLVYSCGHIEGELGKTSCKYCGNCLREYFATMERLQRKDY